MNGFWNVPLAILFSVIALIGFGQLVTAPADVIEIEASALVVADDPVAIPTVDVGTPVENPFGLAGLFSRRQSSCNDGSCDQAPVEEPVEKPAAKPVDDGYLPTPPPTPPAPPAPPAVEEETAAGAGLVAAVGVGAGRCLGRAVKCVGTVVKAAVGRERRAARRAGRRG